MNRWESIAEQFDGIGSIALIAVLVDDRLRGWKTDVFHHSNTQKWGSVDEFFAAADEAARQLGCDDRTDWFGHLFKIYHDQFHIPSGSIPFESQGLLGGEPVGKTHFHVEKMVPDAVRLSARAARDLAEIEPADRNTTDPEEAMPPEIEKGLRETGRIQALPLRLLKFMWKCPVAIHSDLVPHIWDDQPTQLAIRAAVNKANIALLSIQHDKSLSSGGGEISWK